MFLLMNTGGIASTNSFLVADETARQAVIIDAPDHTTQPLLDAAAQRGWDVIGLWLTHGHFDHFADHLVVKGRFPKAQVLIHALDQAKAARPEAQTRMFGLPMVIAPLKADAFVTDNQKLAIGHVEVTVLHTPGHSPGSVVYYIPGEGLLFGGDLIIGGSVGRTDLPDSNHSHLERSIHKVMALPGSTRLLGGHGPGTTLDEERKHNLFVQDALGAP